MHEALLSQRARLEACVLPVIAREDDQPVVPGGIDHLPEPVVYSSERPLVDVPAVAARVESLRVAARAVHVPDVHDAEVRPTRPGGGTDTIDKT